MDQDGPLQAKIDQNGPFWSIECSNPVRSKVILTKMVKNYGHEALSEIENKTILEKTGSRSTILNFCLHSSTLPEFCLFSTVSLRKKKNPPPASLSLIFLIC